MISHPRSSSDHAKMMMEYGEKLGLYSLPLRNLSMHNLAHSSLELKNFQQIWSMVNSLVDLADLRPRPSSSVGRHILCQAIVQTFWIVMSPLHMKLPINCLKEYTYFPSIIYLTNWTLPIMVNKDSKLTLILSISNWLKVRNIWFSFKTVEPRITKRYMTNIETQCSCRMFFSIQGRS